MPAINYDDRQPDYEPPNYTPPWLPGNHVAVDPFESGLNSLYQKYYQRNADPGEVQAHRGNPGGLSAIEKMLQDSLPKQQPQQQPATNPTSWIDETLRSVNSTDDPEYWKRVIGADPNGSGSAKDYWIDRIRRGNGSELVRNGTLSLFQDGPKTGIPGVNVPSYNAQFDDPSTRNLENWLKFRLDELSQPVNDPTRDRLMKLFDTMITRYQQPAYTGPEQEVLRTQALEPIERDRSAARQRALGNIGARGLDPSSGIAQELLNLVDRGFDQSRATAQNDLAYRQIDEQRARDLASVGMAGQAAGLSQTVRNEEQSRRQEAMAIASLLQELPTTALQQALAAAGAGPSPESLAQTAMQLYGIGQNQRQQGLSWYETLGMALPYLTGALKGGGSKTGGLSFNPSDALFGF